MFAESLPISAARRAGVAERVAGHVRVGVGADQAVVRPGLAGLRVELGRGVAVGDRPDVALEVDADAVGAGAVAGLLDRQGVAVDPDHAAAVRHPQETALGRVGHAAGVAADVSLRPGLGLGIEAAGLAAAQPDHAVRVDGHAIPAAPRTGVEDVVGHVRAVDPDQLAAAELRAPEVAVAVAGTAVDAEVVLLEPGGLVVGRDLDHLLDRAVVTVEQDDVDGRPLV